MQDERASKPESLEELVGRIGDSASSRKNVSVEAALKEVGPRSFGPLLLLAGLVTLAPLVGDIPGVPTIMAVFTFLVSGQLLLGRSHFWLPRWLLKRSVSRGKLLKTIEFCRRPARIIDKAIKPRLQPMAHGPGAYVVAACCLLIALCMPVMEVVPFSANGAGAALTAFGLALMANDGLLALLAFVLTVATFGAIAYAVFF